MLHIVPGRDCSLLYLRTRLHIVPGSVHTLHIVADNWESLVEFRLIIVVTLYRSCWTSAVVQEGWFRQQSDTAGPLL